MSLKERGGSELSVEKKRFEPKVFDYEPFSFSTQQVIFPKGKKKEAGSETHVSATPLRRHISKAPLTHFSPCNMPTI